jgi:hypothetical protein
MKYVTQKEVERRGPEKTGIDKEGWLLEDSACLAYSLTLKMEVIHSSEMLVNF